jgi:hypothetical protein
MGTCKYNSGREFRPRVEGYERRTAATLEPEILP